jgi:hypothetical protein
MRPQRNRRLGAATPAVLWIGTTVFLVFCAIGVAAYFLYPMLLPQAEGGSKIEQELVLRRLDESFPESSLLVPVGFALGVVLLLAWFRREQRWQVLLIGSAIVAAFAIPYLLVFTLLFKPTALVLLAPFVLVGLFYVAMMYDRDAQSINAGWASFLGLCRCLVYATLAIVFLLPGCQNYEKAETHSRVLVLIDVSKSMTARDDQPRPGEPATDLPTRQDKVIRLLTASYNLDNQDRTFVQHLLRKSPVVFYRFGGELDKEPVFYTQDQPEPLSKEEFVNWLKPDRTKVRVVAKKDEDANALRLKKQAAIDKLLDATDVAGPALEVVQRESSTSNIQAVVIFSDGQRNKGGDDAVKELLLRASNPKRPIHIVTVGVGDYRQPVRIRLNPLRSPSDVRPDDGPFTVRVPVFGDGLQDQKFEVTLMARRAKDRDGKALDAKGAIPVDKKSGKFKGGGDHPYDEVEFTVDLAKLTGINPKEDPEGRLQGTWEFTAHIPRHPREAAAKEQHVTDPPAQVRVLDKKLRVLLVSSGPSRDYQFARNQFYREVLDKRMELSIYLQNAGKEDVDQDVEGQRLLFSFPDKLGKVEPEERYNNLKEYDVIIAFDVDWTKIVQTTPKALELLKEWVGEHSGGFIFIGGPIHTDRLARPGSPEVRKIVEPLFAILPVTLNDSVLQGLQSKRAPDRTRPWPLKFSGNARSYDFLKLDDNAPEPLAGWSEFFWGTKTWEPGKQPKRGFHSYHPVEMVKPQAEVLATFDDPEAPRIMDGKFEMPYFVSMRYDKGKTFYIGSGEIWRLRLFKEAYYERFLTKLARFVSSGGGSGKTGKFSMAQEVVAGNVVVEAEVLDKEGNPLNPAIRPEVQIVRPAGFDKELDKVTPTKVLLSAKKGEPGKRFRGIFTGVFPAETPGQYTVKLEIPGAEPFDFTFNVIPPNVEMGNLRTNFDHLYQMATESGPALERLSEETRTRVQQALDSSRGTHGKDVKGTRLFFKLSSAQVIPELLLKVPPQVNSTKGKFEDLWDYGSRSGWKLEFHHVMMITVGCIGLLASAILFFLGRWIVATCVISTAAVIVLGFWLVDLIYGPPWLVMPIEMSVVLGFIVGLLSIEWLTRKLLKLA